MLRLKFDIHINAPREAVWACIVINDLYHKWTNVFTPTSHFDGQWKEGESIHFLMNNAEGGKDGMYAVIDKCTYLEYISIKHLGYIHNGKIDTDSEEIRLWAPAYENYTLIEKNNFLTHFVIEQDVTDDYYAMFADLWPKALDALKCVAEALAKNSIFPCIWYSCDYVEAFSFYNKIFISDKNSQNNAINPYSSFNGLGFYGLNGAGNIKPSPAHSYYIYCGNNFVIDSYYEKLKDGGQILMPLGKYMWSEKYAWVIDKFGISWQMDVDNIRSAQKIVPTLLLVNDKKHLVQSLIDDLKNIFSDCVVLMTSPHPPNTGMPENSILFAQMRLNGCLMNIMSSSMSHDFDFTAANSLVIPCASQEEIDHYWHHLGVGGNHSNCGWLSDKYGIFWQITPSFMPQIMADPSMCSRVIPLLRSMTKINIKDLFL